MLDVKIRGALGIVAGLFVGIPFGSFIADVGQLVGPERMMAIGIVSFLCCMSCFALAIDKEF